MIELAGLLDLFLKTHSQSEFAKIISAVVKAIALEARGFELVSRTSPIGRSVANGSPPL